MPLVLTCTKPHINTLKIAHTHTHTRTHTHSRRSRRSRRGTSAATQVRRALGCDLKNKQVINVAAFGYRGHLAQLMPFFVHCMRPRMPTCTPTRAHSHMHAHTHTHTHKHTHTHTLTSTHTHTFAFPGMMAMSGGAPPPGMIKHEGGGYMQPSGGVPYPPAPHVQVCVSCMCAFVRAPMHASPILSLSGRCSAL